MTTFKINLYYYKKWENQLFFTLIKVCYLQKRGNKNLVLIFFVAMKKRSNQIKFRNNFYEIEKKILISGSKCF